MPIRQPCFDIDHAAPRGARARERLVLRMYLYYVHACCAASFDVFISYTRASMKQSYAIIIIVSTMTPINVFHLLAWIGLKERYHIANNNRNSKLIGMPVQKYITL